MWAFKVGGKSNIGMVLEGVRSWVGVIAAVQRDVLSVKCKDAGSSRIPTLISFSLCVCICMLFFSLPSPFYGEDFYCEIPRTFRHLSFYIFDRDVFRRDSIIGM